MDIADINRWLPQTWQIHEREKSVTLSGCSRQDVEQLCATLGALPPSYQAFLFWMGQDGGGFLKGSRVFYNELFTLKKSAEELLVEAQVDTQLPADAVVIWMHQGYQFLFFRTSEGDNPHIHFWHESYKEQGFILNKFRSLDHFLCSELTGHNIILKALETGTDGDAALDLMLDRTLDAEVNSLLQVAENLGNPDWVYCPERTGRIRLATDAEVCICCALWINRFRTVFPNIELSVESIER